MFYQNKHKLSNNKKLLFAVIGFFIFLFFWSLITYSGLIKPFFLPSPTAMIYSLYNLFINENFLMHILISLYRIFTGFILAFLIAMPLGFFMAIFEKFESILEPIIAFVRYIPPAALIPLAILWFGISNTEKIFIVFVGIFFYTLLMVIDTVKSTPIELIEHARILGLSRIQIITRVILPNSLPRLWEIFRYEMAGAWTMLIIAELVGSTMGIGALIIRSQRFLQTSKVFAGVFAVGLIGLITDLFLSYSYKKLFPWMRGMRR